MNRKYTHEQVREMRAYAVESGLSPREMHEARYPSVDIGTLYGIIYNNTYRDPAYTPPPYKGRADGGGRPPVTTATCFKCGLTLPLEAFPYGTTRKNGKTWHYRHRQCRRCLYDQIETSRRSVTARRSTSRKASIDCRHVCPTCGMGFDSEAEAMECCKRMVAG